MACWPDRPVDLLVVDVSNACLGLLAAVSTPLPFPAERPLKPNARFERQSSLYPPAPNTLLIRCRPSLPPFHAAHDCQRPHLSSAGLFLAALLNTFQL